MTVPHRFRTIGDGTEKRPIRLQCRHCRYIRNVVPVQDDKGCGIDRNAEPVTSDTQEVN